MVNISDSESINSKEAILLSIIVPTKNREPVLRPLIRALLTWPEHFLIEFVIHDNSDKPLELNEFNDPRLVYIHSSVEMDMGKNFDTAILASRGEFICIIGDDDLVLPNAYEIAVSMKALDLLAATCEVATYYWPGVCSHWVKENPNGVLILKDMALGDRLGKVENGLYKILEKGGVRYEGYLPSVYQGIVSRDLLVNLTEELGTAFPGPSPDIANAVAISGKYSTYLVAPSFIVSGYVLGSGGAEGAAKKHHGELASRAYMFNEGKLEWPTIVPRFFSGVTIWAATILITLKKQSRAASCDQFNSAALLAYCIVYHPKYIYRILDVIRTHGDKSMVMNVGLRVTRVLLERLSIYVDNFKLRFSFLGSGTSKYGFIAGLSDTYEVHKYMKKHFNNKGE